MPSAPPWRVPQRYTKKGNWKTTGVSPLRHHPVGGHLPGKGSPVEGPGLTDSCANLWRKPLCSTSSMLKALPFNLVRQPCIKDPLLAAGFWSLLFIQRPSLVVNMALFSQTKQGPSLEVARHTVWCAQTFWLLTGQLTLAESSLLLYFTNVCVFLPAPLGKRPCFMATCHWQGISHQDWNLQPSPRLPTLHFRAQRGGGSSWWSGEGGEGVRKVALGSSIVAFFTAVINKSPHSPL